MAPFRLKHLTLRNRIVSTAHAPHYVENGHPRDRYRLYHEEKARGGVGMTMVGGSTTVSPDSPSVFGQLYAGDDSIVPWFQRLTDGVRRHGAAILCQITHMGRRTAWDDGDWLPVIAPSGVRERAHRAFPKAMEAHDIDRVVSDFVAAARRCKAGGFDGLELLVHAHLLGQFLSPLTNARQDDYGGPLENRLRLVLAVLSAVRSEVGADFVISIRLTGDELADGGLTASECVAVAQRLEQSGHVDLLNVVAGAPYDDLGLADWVPPMGRPAAPHLGIAGAIRAAVSLPVLHAGGMADTATAAHALKSGLVDLVGMTRAHIADPHLVNKLQRGEAHRIRPCVGLGYCVDRVNQGKPSVCGHNAATGREGQLPHRVRPANQRKKVLVVGGGPGGLEAARVCALRGHEVVLCEATHALGGQLRLASKAPTRRQIWGVADWLINEVTQLGVTVRFDCLVDAATVDAERPDAVIVATGCWPAPLDIPGAGLVTPSWDVLSGEARVHGDVLLCDEVGDQASAVTADALVHTGCRLDIATPDRMLLQDLGPTTSSVALRALSAGGAAFSPLRELVAVARDGNRLRATLRDVLTQDSDDRLVDHVVSEHGGLPNDAVFLDLVPRSRNRGQLDLDAMIAGRGPFPDRDRDGTFMLARVGDAVARRNLHAAVLDALRVCHRL
ncbi:MAG: FAD-dependent oxidoreductase [Pseudomonadota bacterium]